MFLRNSTPATALPETGDSGFTLFELLTVGIIVSILSLIAIPMIHSGKEKAYRVSALNDSVVIAKEVTMLLYPLKPQVPDSISVDTSTQTTNVVVQTTTGTKISAIRVSPGTSVFGYIGDNMWCVQVTNHGMIATTDSLGHQHTDGTTCTSSGKSSSD